MNKYVNEKFKPSHDLSNIVKIDNLKLIMTTIDDAKYSSIQNSDEFRVFWFNVLTKLGYTEDEAKSVYMSQTVPEF